MPMVDLRELLIGDKLLLLSSNRIGVFQGTSGQKARVKVGDKILLVSADNLDLCTDKADVVPSIDLSEEPSKPLDFHNFVTTLDLHIEALAPEMTTQPATVILRYQLSKLAEYLDQAEQAGAKYLTVIHGKGTGVLKKEVLHMLGIRSSVQFVLEKHDGGAVEVHLS